MHKWFKKLSYLRQISVLRVSGVSILLFALSGCMDSVSQTLPVSAGGFAGATSAQNVNGTTVTVNWPLSGSPYTHYEIYNVLIDGTLQPITALPINQTSYTQTGLTPGTLYSFVVQAVDANNNVDGNHTIVSALGYSGVSSTVNSIGTTTATLNFQAPGANAAGAHVYCKIRATGSFSPLTSIFNTSQTTVALTGLLSGTTYTCRVNAILSNTQTDDNNNAVVTFQTLSQTFNPGPSPAYNGVILVQAFGDAPSAPTSITAPSSIISFPVTTPTTRQVSITWNNFNISNATQATYVLVRTPQGGTLDMNTNTPCSATTTGSCQVCVSSPGNPAYNAASPTAQSATAYSRTCTDTIGTLADPATQKVVYDYAISLVVNPATNPVMSEETPSSISTNYVSDAAFRITVHVPPANMVLVQRDSANYEMCTLMGLRPDPLNHQRCSYNVAGTAGTGSIPYSATASGANPLNLTAGYYDFGYNLFIDRWNAGCNWTQAATTGMCGAGNSSGNCVGSGVPASSIGVNGNTYYDYTGGGCYVRQSNIWYSLNAPSSINPTNLANSYTNSPNPSAQIPPMVNISQTSASQVCQSIPNTYYGFKRLLRRREQVAASAFQWIAGEPAALSDAAISFTQNGLDHPNNLGCNSNSHAGVTFSGSFGTSNTELASTVGAIGSFVIGSDYTTNCVSRFGAQDMSGNVAEWVSDQLSSCTAGNQCFGTTSSLDTGNRDLASFNFNGVQGPGGTSMSSWALASPTYSANYFSAPLGIPFLGTDAGNALFIGTGISNQKLHGETITINSSQNPGSARGTTTGGNWNSATASGRFTADFTNLPTVTATNIGYRCALPAQ